MSWFDGEGNDSGRETTPALAANFSVETDSFSVADVSSVGEDILSGGIGGRGESWDGDGLAFLVGSTGDFLGGSTLKGLVGLGGSRAATGDDSIDVFGVGEDFFGGSIDFLDFFTICSVGLRRPADVPGVGVEDCELGLPFDPLLPPIRFLLLRPTGFFFSFLAGIDKRGPSNLWPTSSPHPTEI